jgi:hypothetical protein
MAKSGKRTLGISALLVIGIGMFGGWSYAKRRDRLLYLQTVEGFESDVNRGLPLGSPKATVQEFLKAHAIQYFDFDPKAAFGEGTVINDPWYSGSSQSVQGGTGWIGSCRIEVEFKFDNSEKLLGFRDKPACKVSLF